jgi:hypothetical protein
VDHVHTAAVTASGLPSPDRLAFLLAGNLQEDDVPLWEIVWHLNREAPTASLDQKIRLARRVLPLLADEYDLWRGEWPGGPVAPMSAAEIQAMATDDACWHDPENASILVWLRPPASDVTRR